MPKTLKIRWLAAPLRAFQGLGGGLLPFRLVRGLKSRSSEVK